MFPLLPRYKAMGGDAASGAERLHPDAIPMGGASNAKSDRCGWTFYSSLLEECLQATADLRSILVRLGVRDVNCINSDVLHALGGFTSRVEYVQLYTRRSLASYHDSALTALMHEMVSERPRPRSNKQTSRRFGVSTTEKGGRRAKLSPHV